MSTCRFAMVILGLLVFDRGLVLAELPPLVPREELFGNPEKYRGRISPDGTRVAWTAPDDKNVLQVWVKTFDKEDARIVTADKKRGIRVYDWAWDDATLLYQQDQDGDENWHVYGVDLASNNVRDYTPFQGVRAEILTLDPKRPGQMLVTANVRNRELMDVYRVDLATGAFALDTENPGDVAGWIPDATLQVRGAQIVPPDGGTEIRIRDDLKSPWRSWMKVGPEEILDFVAFAADGRAAIVTSSVGSNTARVVRRDIASGAETILAASDAVDAGDVMMNPHTHAVEAVAFNKARSEWTPVDPSVKADLEGLAKVEDGDFFVVNRDRKDQVWLVYVGSDRNPGRYYAWDRAAKKATLLFATQPRLEKAALAPTKPVVIESRDGLDLHSYLTLPVGVAPRDLPTVLLVHGGPWGRDAWGFDNEVQWLANRGYAVLQVNFRASTGFGKAFLNAGNKEWGRRMHDDLIDAVQWAHRQGVADSKKVAIYGGSYGGYAALAGVTFTPDTFACAVDIVGPSNLKTLIGSIPPYWKPMRAMFDVRMGNVDDPKDAELVKEASPLFRADRIVKPLLIGQGANDPRVKQAESEQIVAAIEKNKGKVTYVLYTDEGHGFARPENRIDFNARAEAFLGECLGGRVEPMSGEKHPGSTSVVRVVGSR